MPGITVSPRIRTSPYYASTVAAGVTEFSVYNKMLMPMTYGDRAAEYRRLTEGVAIWDVGAERQLELSGPDADACVQYLTARDLSKMKEGQGKYVALCDHDGTLLNDPVLLKLCDRYWFSLADADMLLWARGVAAERGFDVTVREPDVSPLAVQGPLAEDVIAELFGEHVRELRYFWFLETDLHGIPVVLCRSGWSKQGGFELFLRDGTKGDELWGLVMAAGREHDMGPGAPNHVERVESGLLSFGGDTTPGSNPLEAGMARYVSIETDVDYIGKAALRRIAAEGPARLLVGVMLDKVEVDPWPLPARTEVSVDGRQVGTMSALVHSPRLDRTIGIAQIDSDVVASGAAVEVSSPGGRHPATLCELPFI